MDASRIRQGEMIAAVAAVALFIIMFLSWYSVEGFSDEAQEQAEAAIELAEEQGIEVPADAQEAVDDASNISAWDVVRLHQDRDAPDDRRGDRDGRNVGDGSQVNLPIAMSAIVAGLGISDDAPCPLPTH